MKLFMIFRMAAACVCVSSPCLENVFANAIPERRPRFSPRLVTGDTVILDDTPRYDVRRCRKRIPINVGKWRKLTKQAVVHIASRSLGPSKAPQFVCISGIACFCAANQALKQSEAAQRACCFWKRAGPIVAHYKFTQWWLKATKASLERRNTVYKSLHDRYATPSLQIALDLKGLYVKMGQVMSSRSDFMPLQYVELFSTLQDAVPQWPIEQAVQIVRESLQREWCVDYNDVFEFIDPVALGCAAIGQVHRAELKDPWVTADSSYTGGKVVVIKIMHPNAQKRFACDFQVFKWLTRVAMPGWRPLLEELERRLMTEFCYKNEMENQLLLRNNLMKSPYKRKVRIPQPYVNLCCKNVLVMEMLDGIKLKDSIQLQLAQLAGGDKERVEEFMAQRQREIMLGKGAASEASTLVDLLDLHGIRGVIRGLKALALYRKLRRDVDLLVDVHGHQIFHDASFNADPHPGNTLELSDGRLGLIDFGQTKKLAENERDDFARVVVALGSKADNNKIADAMRRAGFKSKLDADDALAEYAALFFDSDFVHKEKGFATPQHYFQSLMAADPLIHIPDSAIMIARVSLLFRGAGSAINHQVQTSHNWMKHAKQALEKSAKK